MVAFETFDILKEHAPLAGPEDDIGPHRKGFLSVKLAIATHDRKDRVRREAAELPDVLAGFLVGCGCDGAGIDNDEVGFYCGKDLLMPRFLKGVAEGVKLVGIDFAA
jgi:hypothetical protein